MQNFLFNRVVLINQVGMTGLSILGYIFSDFNEFVT